MDTHLNVSLVLSDKSVDIRIPKKVTVQQLSQELISIFNLKLTRYQLRVLNKGLLHFAGDSLNDYPITSGDRILLEEY